MIFTHTTEDIGLDTPQVQSPLCSVQRSLVAKLSLIVLLSASSILARNPLHAQPWLPTIQNRIGDTVEYTWPPPDSSYLPDQLIIKFRDRGGALNYEHLCYEYPWFGTSPKEPRLQSSDNDCEPCGPIIHHDLDSTLKKNLMAQRFHIDSGIIVDPSLHATLSSFGVTHLRRMTSANPCADTLTHTRPCELIWMDDYNWMVAEFDNDTSAIDAVVALGLQQYDKIALLSLDYYLNPNPDPNDPNYLDGSQFGMSDQMGMSRAWDFQTGDYCIKIGIVDHGIDFNHCDLGGGRGLGRKVVGGWSWTENNANFAFESHHGTPVAGIAGALTNNTTCGTETRGAAGIAGGWSPDSLGCQLFGFRVAVPSSAYDDFTPMRASFIVAAILEASAFNPQTGYGYGVHVLNNSYRSRDPISGIGAAVRTAHRRGVSFVAARGNEDDSIAQYPASLDEDYVISVGASRRDTNRADDYSSFGGTMDVIAPAGNFFENVVLTTRLGGGYRVFRGTSAAAPHAAGLVALLRSEALRWGWNLVPEDYDGMLRASALDRDSTPNTPFYRTGFDDRTGWGHIRGDEIFEMLNDGYRVSRHSLSSQGLTFGSWTDPYKMVFFNEGVGGEPIQANGVYLARRRRVSGTISLPRGVWDLNDQLYVWGRVAEKGGFTAANPNNQRTWTRVTSGRGNNRSREQLGIWHNHSLNVTAETWQYEVFTISGRNIGTFPATNDIALNISVFGREFGASSVADEVIDESLGDLLLSVEPTTERLEVEFRAKERGEVSVEIVDMLGQVLKSSATEIRSSGKNRLSVSIEGLPSGSYICSLEAGNAKDGRVFVLTR
ncbi:MAG: S8 family serine peptidase [Chlorobi bacterium]|nr:S8 family serine peptidase [Chlorobiota bacterium]